MRVAKAANSKFLHILNYKKEYLVISVENILGSLLVPSWGSSFEITMRKDAIPSEWFFVVPSAQR